MIQEGQTAFLQTTGEEVFVLAAYENKRELPENSGLSGWVAIVRRPVSGDNGVYHMVEKFTMEELETKEARIQRYTENQKAFERRLAKAAEESGFETAETSPNGDDNLPN